MGDYSYTVIFKPLEEGHLEGLAKEGESIPENFIPTESRSQNK